VLAGLMDCYHAAEALTKNLGVRGLPALAAWHARQVAEQLDDVAYLAYADWVRASTVAVAGDRGGMLAMSTKAAAGLSGHLGDPRVRQMAGMLHLSCAFASATVGAAGDAAAHLGEADALAAHGPREAGPGFGNLYFCPDNIAIFRLSVAVELGEHGRARDYAARFTPHHALRCPRDRHPYWRLTDVRLQRAIVWERGRGAGWEQTYALNGAHRASTNLYSLH
jgi:hypothetical protein